MNEFILNLAGFTPSEWREFRGRLANKFLFYWRRLVSEVTAERIRAVFIVLLAALVIYFGVRLGLKYWPQRGGTVVEGPKEATQSAGPKKERLEITLEGLKKELETALETPPDLEYPSLDVKVSFE